MNFKYIAIDKQGVKQKGRLEANDQKEVIEYLRLKGMTPLGLKRVEKSSLFGYFNRVKNSDVVLFTRQLASMILTGLTVIESLNIIKQQTTKPQFLKVINEIIASISEGTALSQAMANYPAIFPQVYVALIRAAEEGGILDKVLERLADNLEKSEQLQKKVKSALFYPAIIMSGVGIVIVMMNIFVIPQMGALYDSLGIPLPMMTQIVLTGSKITKALVPVFIIGLPGIIIGVQRFTKTPTGIRLVDKVKLRLPIFAEITRLGALTEISRTLSMLLNAGSSLIGAIGIAADVSGNIYYKQSLDTVAELVEKGATLSQALQNQNMYPQVMIQMVKVGESTGKLDESLLKVSEYFARDLDGRVSTLTTAMEPILIITLGISVAFLIISVITPIYSLVSQIQ